MPKYKADIRKKKPDPENEPDFYEIDRLFPLRSSSYKVPTNTALSLETTSSALSNVVSPCDSNDKVIHSLEVDRQVLHSIFRKKVSEIAMLKQLEADLSTRLLGLSSGNGRMAGQTTVSTTEYKSILLRRLNGLLLTKESPCMRCSGACSCGQFML